MGGTGEVSGDFLRFAGAEDHRSDAGDGEGELDADVNRVDFKSLAKGEKFCAPGEQGGISRPIGLAIVEPRTSDQEAGVEDR